MFNLKYFKAILFGDKPAIPNLALSSYEELPAPGLTMGTLYIGKPGSGKTSSLARHLFESFKTYPDRAIFVLDWSGPITDALLSLILSDPDRDELLKRVVYDEMGHPEWVIPLPEFHESYGGDYESQVQRVALNLAKLAPELVKDAPFLAGLGLREIAPQIGRILTAIENEHGEPYQITEAKKLIVDDKLLARAVSKFGHKVPEAKWFMEKVFLPLRTNERELRCYAILALLGAIEPKEIRARIGYYRPAWTPHEAIQKGQLILCNGSRLINQKNTQHYLFTQVYSLIMAEINRRIPGDPNDKPVALVMDEVYSLLSIPGMAEEVGMLSPLYRSRKLELYVVLQSFSQLAKPLDEQIWSLGNVVCFSLANFDDAYKIAQQLFKYEPEKVKLQELPSDRPIMEPDRGQYLIIANWIQRLDHRECVMRQYHAEKYMDKYVRHVHQTRDVVISVTKEMVDEVKERLLRDKGVRVREALDLINQRGAVQPQARPAL